MQHPVGMAFNPDTVRFEMENFWAVLFSPVAMAKFTHTTSSSFIVGSFFVIAVSSWYLIKGRHVEMAKKSIIVASIFGLLSATYAAWTGDESAYSNASTQPMKLAAYEGLYDGEKNAAIVALGVLNPAKRPGDQQAPFLFELKIPGLLSLLANRESGSFVPGINDLVYGNEQEGIVSVAARMEQGKVAISDLAAYKTAKKAGDAAAARGRPGPVQHQHGFSRLRLSGKPRADRPIGGHDLLRLSYHGVFRNILSPRLPALPGFSVKDTLAGKRGLLLLGVASFFLAMIASQSGWVVAEVGRQPWAIQGLLPVNVATTDIATGSVQTTFFMFLAVFTLLLAAEIKIMLKQISIGPEGL